MPKIKVSASAGVGTDTDLVFLCLTNDPPDPTPIPSNITLTLEVGGTNLGPQTVPNNNTDTKVMLVYPSATLAPVGTAFRVSGDIGDLENTTGGIESKTPCSF